MSSNPGQVNIRGLENWPTINVRSGPSTTYDLLFKLEKGTIGSVIDAAPDETGKALRGKTYQWLKLRLPDGRECWARDDLINLRPGDHTDIGYGKIFIETFAFSLTRETSYPRAAEPAGEEAPVEQPASPSIWQPASAEPAGEQSPVAEEPASTSVWQPATSEPAGETPGVEQPVGEEPAVTEPADSEPEPAAPQPDVAIVIGSRTSIRVRSGPSTSYAQAMVLERGTRLTILDVAPQEGGGSYKWVKIVTAQNTQGWVREDLLSYLGRLAIAKGLLAGADMYPAPIESPNYWWVRGFTGPQPDHPGWDLGAEQGEPLLAGPQGGQVISVFRAAKPTLTRPSVVDHGIPLGDPSIFSDEGWGDGYGHYVVIRYTYDKLPASTQKWLDNKGMTGGAMFAMYAHMHTIFTTIAQGATLAAGEAFGTVGTTGNSEAPHVHLEVRASANANETSWSRLASGLVTPRVLFKA